MRAIVGLIDADAGQAAAEASRREWDAIRDRIPTWTPPTPRAGELMGPGLYAAGRSTNANPDAPIRSVKANVFPRGHHLFHHLSVLTLRAVRSSCGPRVVGR